jgi:uncharacterized membrane protein HdeD (DUF308 family)
MPGSWIAEFILGLGILVLGLIVAAHPTHSLNLVGILIGVAMIAAGVYQVVRSLQADTGDRAWRAIGGILFFLAGIFFIRHIGLTLALIGLFAGFAFIIAGIAALAEAVGPHSTMTRIWAVLFGLIALAAGISAIVTPIHSLTRLAIVLGWGLAAIGIMSMIGAFVSWRELRKLREELQPGQVSVPGQRSEVAGVEGYGGSPGTSAEAQSAEHRHRRSRL